MISKRTCVSSYSQLYISIVCFRSCKTYRNRKSSQKVPWINKLKVENHLVAEKRKRNWEKWHQKKRLPGLHERLRRIKNTRKFLYRGTTLKCGNYSAIFIIFHINHPFNKSQIFSWILFYSKIIRAENFITSGITNWVTHWGVTCRWQLIVIFSSFRLFTFILFSRSFGSLKCGFYQMLVIFFG